MIIHPQRWIEDNVGNMGYQERSATMYLRTRSMVPDQTK